MEKSVVLDIGGEVSSFSFTKVDREKLYGKKTRVIVDESGVACDSAWLLADGATVVPPGGTSSIYVNAQFDTVERSSLTTVDAEGQELPVVPSTLGVTVPIKQVDARQVLDHLVTNIYQLEAVTLGAQLKQSLEAGQIFESRFNLRDGHDESSAFIVKNDQGIFALIVRSLDFDFVGREVAVAETANEEETLGDELDFGMM